MPVLSTRIVLDCFYLLIFYSEKFSTDVCRLPYAVNVNLNLSYDLRLRQTANVNLYHVTNFSLYFSFTINYIIINISSFTPGLSKRIVLDCFYLLIFHFKTFSTSIWPLPFALNMTLSLWTWTSRTLEGDCMSLKITCEIRKAREGRVRKPAGARNPSFLHPQTAAIRYNIGL